MPLFCREGSKPAQYACCPRKTFVRLRFYSIGSKFLLLFSIKSKEERLCFAEKVPNGRISNVAQANFLVRMHPIGACAANSWRDCAHQKKGVFRLLFFISFYTHRRKTLLPSPPVFRPFPPTPNRDFHPDSGRRYPRDRSDKYS